MAHLFKNLPHVMGTITNLDADESMRALASIKSELSRRQRIFMENDVNHINAYTSLFKAGKAEEPLPHLFIISDEFAELKKEQPDFMTELVSTARLGRSLGVHLILATQKPSGVVTDQIWSNSRFKLALKVQDEADSKEIIKSVDAAYIRNPGRAYLQVGNNEIYELFQSAYSGAFCNAETGEEVIDNRIYIRNHLGQMELLNEDLSELDIDEDKQSTQLDITVDYINELYAGMHCKGVMKPWLPPLEYYMISPYIVKEENDLRINRKEVDLKVQVGMLDIPCEQKQMEYIYDFKSDGNLAIFGAPGYGKSTLITTILMTLAVKNGADLLQYYILDMGSGSLITLRELPNTADYMNFDDNEKLTRFMQLISNEIKKRKQLISSASVMNFDMYNRNCEEKLPAILWVLDNYDVGKSMDEELDSFVTQVARDGLSLGIYVILSASRPGILRFNLLGTIKSKIALYMYDKSETNSVVGRPEYGIKEIRGRALVKLESATELQVYTAADMSDEEAYVEELKQRVCALKESYHGIKAKKIAVMPKELDIKVLKEYCAELQSNVNLIPIGLNTSSLECECIDVSKGAQLIIGTGSSGRTNLNKVILSMTSSEVEIFVVDGKLQELSEFSVKENIHYVADVDSFWNMLDELKGIIQTRTTEYEKIKEADKTVNPRSYYSLLNPIIIFVSELEDMVSYIGKAGKVAEEMLVSAAEYNIVSLVSANSGKLRGIDAYTRYIRELATGMVVGNFQAQSVFSAIGVRVAPDNTLGVGYVCDKGNVSKVQVAKYK